MAGKKARRKKRSTLKAEPTRKRDGLSSRERRFVAEFLLCGNASEAYRRAGYSEKSANANAVRLRARESISSAIATAEQEAWKRCQMSNDELLGRLSHVSRGEIPGFVSWDAEGNTTWTPSDQLTPAQRIAVKSFKRTRKTIPCGQDEIVEVTLELKLHDNLSAMKMLAQKAGLFTYRVEHSGPGGGPIELTELSPEQRKQRLEELLAKRNQG